MAAADMLLNPKIETFQDSLERLCDSLINIEYPFAISCPIDDPTTAHVMSDMFLTVAIRRLANFGFPSFIHQDCERGLCAVVYVR